MHKRQSPHGDYDHMGEAINLVNNFKVDKVIFNCGELNKLELDLIGVLNKKKFHIIHALISQKTFYSYKLKFMIMKMIIAMSFIQK